MVFMIILVLVTSGRIGESTIYRVYHPLSISANDFDAKNNLFDENTGL